MNIYSTARTRRRPTSQLPTDNTIHYSGERLLSKDKDSIWDRLGNIIKIGICKCGKDRKSGDEGEEMKQRFMIAKG